MTAENKKSNYIVRISDWNGKRIIVCNDEDAVWEAIGSRTFGGLYEVSSPTGKNVNQFMPF